MPRSSPSTEEDLFELRLDAPRSPAEAQPPTRAKKIRPAALIIAVAALAGLALLPGGVGQDPSPTTMAALPDPALATTTTALPTTNRATLLPSRFDLVALEVPVEDVLGYAGPVMFEDRAWLLASGRDGNAVVLRSTDGMAWEVVGVVPSSNSHITIHDLVAHDGELVAIGTVSSSSGALGSFGYPDQVVVWRSNDGAGWVESTLVNDGTTWHPQLTLVSDGHALLVGGQEVTAVASAIEALIPADLIAELRTGRLDVAIVQDPVASIVVIAPPGIEVYRSELFEAIDLDERNLLLYSDRSEQWAQVEIGADLITWQGLVARPGRGFLARTSDGDMYTTVDGRGWGRNRTIPQADYTRWGDWLVGIEVQPWSDQLVIGSGSEFARVEQPTDKSALWSESGQVIAGSVGLLSVVPAYAGPATEVSVDSGSQRFTLRADMFSIAGAGSDRASVFFHRLPGSFNSTTGEVLIDIAGRDRVVIDIARLQVLRAEAASLWTTQIYASTNGLDWQSAQTALPGQSVAALGAVPGGFLLAVDQSVVGGSSPRLYFARMPPIG